MRKRVLVGAAVLVLCFGVARFGICAPYEIISDNPGVVTSLFGFDLDEDGNIYVPDFNSRQLIKFNGKGEVLLRIPVSGAPQCVWVDKKGNIYVGSAWGKPKGLYKFAPDGAKKFDFADTNCLETEDYVSRVALDSRNNIYVLLRKPAVVKKYGKNGELIEGFGDSGALLGFAPGDIVLDSNDNLYLSDGKLGKVIKFDKNGKKLKEVDFPKAHALGVDKDNNIYAGAYPYKFAKFSQDLEKLAEFKTKGIHHARGIRVDKEGNIYISDMWRLRKFKSDLTPANEFSGTNMIGGGGWKDKHFTLPQDIAVDQDGNLVVCGTDDRIQRITSDGIGFMGKFKTKKYYNWAIALDNEGDIYVGNGTYNTVTKFTGDGVPVNDFGGKNVLGSPGTEVGQFKQVSALALDKEGNIYVGEGVGSRIQKFRKDGSPANDFSGKNVIGLDGNCGGIALDKEGNIYASISNRHQVSKFKPDGSPVNEFKYKGTLINAFGSRGSNVGQFMRPVGVAVDVNGDIYVADSGNARVQRFNAKGQFIASFGSFGYAPGQMRSARGIVLDGKGYVYVTDTANSRIYSIKIDEALKGE